MVHNHAGGRHAAPSRTSIADVLTADQVANAATGSTPRPGLTAASPPAISRRGRKTTCSCPKTRRSRASWATRSSRALQRSPLFIAAALPARVFPPLFNRYQGGQSFGNHVDNAIRHVAGTPVRIRTDLSATLFLSVPTNTTAASWSSRTPTASTR